MKLTCLILVTKVDANIVRGEQESEAFHDTVISLAQHSGLNQYSTAISFGEACYNLSHRIGKTLIPAYRSTHLIWQANS